MNSGYFTVRKGGDLDSRQRQLARQHQPTLMRTDANTAAFVLIEREFIS